MESNEINGATQLAGRIVAPLLALVILAAGCSSAHAATANTNRARSSAASAPLTSAEPVSAAKPVAATGRVIQLDGKSLTIADIIDIANAKARVEFAPAGIDRINAARAVVDHYIAAKLPAYGITTMYGADFKTTLSPAQMLRFGRINIVQEATRVGDGTMPIVDTGTMRAAWALLANSYARGFSGASPELANTLINRVNSGNVPDDVEWDNSMGDADFTANAQAAMSLLADPKFELKAGEATNLLTHNFITVAMAAEVVDRAEREVNAQEAALALSMEGFRANPAPLTQLESRQDVLGSRTSVKNGVTRLLKGSLLWKAKGPRQLQDFLSLRDGAESIAALRLQLTQYVPVLEAFANSNQGSPIVDVASQKLLSVPDYDTSQVTLGMDGLRQALALVAIGSNSRGLKMLSKPFTDLPSGLVEGNPDSFNGIYTRNITYLMTSLERSALTNTTPVTNLTESYVAEGDEDYSPAFPNSVMSAQVVVDRTEQVTTLEALIGAVAVQRRIASGELTKNDVPPALRALQAGIVKRSPLAIPIDKQYNLASLLTYYRSQFPAN
ncbi:MAG TPA: aromatic amino acid lyase [Gaiellales bacterium]|nr:aromatic amino acid lyase [Gaiellales bacterium]